ncbi:MAG: hypothetical protein H8E20_14440 [Verrucomicrobia bacterium]|nr:hypothetical protein [Verrucomicrobiota bacterium]
MSTVEEIESAIQRLDTTDQQRIASWMVEKLEDQADLKIALASLAEPGENTPWEKVKQENGLCD